jgi:hypothetical protein
MVTDPKPAIAEEVRTAPGALGGSDRERLDGYI